MNNIIKKLKGFPFTNNQKNQLIDTINNVCNENIKNIGGVEWSYLDDIKFYGIDLGLPSGTIWADRNVGANESAISDSSTTPGTLLLWGNLEDKGSGQINDKWFTQYGYKYSKYTDADGKYILDKEDDAATMLFGKNWCMPSIEDCNELIEYCKISYITSLFVDLVGPNGNHIKFIKPHNKMNQVSIDTLCWTNELMRYGYNAAHLTFKTYEKLTTSDLKERSTYSFIRPIYKPKK